jgi:hypothetical protein
MLFFLMEAALIAGSSLSSIYFNLGDFSGVPFFSELPGENEES